MKKRKAPLWTLFILTNLTFSQILAQDKKLSIPPPGESEGPPKNGVAHLDIFEEFNKLEAEGDDEIDDEAGVKNIFSEYDFEGFTEEEMKEIWRLQRRATLYLEKVKALERASNEFWSKYDEGLDSSRVKTDKLYEEYPQAKKTLSKPEFKEFLDKLKQSALDTISRMEEYVEIFNRLSSLVEGIDNELENLIASLAELETDSRIGKFDPKMDKPGHPGPAQWGWEVRHSLLEETPEKSRISTLINGDSKELVHAIEHSVLLSERLRLEDLENGFYSKARHEAFLDKIERLKSVPKDYIQTAQEMKNTLIEGESEEMKKLRQRLVDILFEVQHMAYSEIPDINAKDLGIFRKIRSADDLYKRFERMTKRSRYQPTEEALSIIVKLFIKIKDTIQEFKEFLKMVVELEHKLEEGIQIKERGLRSDFGEYGKTEESAPKWFNFMDMSFTEYKIIEYMAESNIKKIKSSSSHKLKEQEDKLVNIQQLLINYSHITITEADQDREGKTPADLKEEEERDIEQEKMLADRKRRQVNRLSRMIATSRNLTREEIKSNKGKRSLLINTRRDEL